MGGASSIFGYTGEQTDATSLVFLRARYYDARTGRFLSRDSFPGYLNLPQSQNPYAYGLNNPLLYTDPSGKCPMCVVAVVGALLGGGIDLYMQLRNNGGNWQCINWAEVAISAGAAAVGALVFSFVFVAMIPEGVVGATALDYFLAGGISNVFAAQATNVTMLALSGQSNRILDTLFRPGDVLNQFILGGVGTVAGNALVNALNRVADDLLGGLGEVSYFDEMLSPSMGHEGYYTGEFQPISINSQGPIYVTERGIAITSETLALQGTSPSVGDFTGLEYATVDEWISRIPRDYTWGLPDLEPPNGLKFTSPDKMNTVRFHEPFTYPGMQPTAPGVGGWVARVETYDPTNIYANPEGPFAGWVSKNSLGNFVPGGDAAHIPMLGNTSPYNPVPSPAEILQFLSRFGR